MSASGSSNRTRLLITFELEGLPEAVRTIEGIDCTVATDREEILRRIAEAEVLCVTDFDREMLAQARSVRWVQAMLGGVERVLFPEFIASPVPLTCVKECFAAPGADHAMASILAVSYRIDYYLRQQAARSFEFVPPHEISGKTLGIVGFGNIGQALAKRAKAFDMRVLALVRRARANPAPADEVLPSEQLPRLLGESDFVVVAVPLTSKTRGMIGAAQIELMKPTAHVIDISGRPALVDQEAVIRALQRNRIACADLQFAAPPPRESPLWQMNNLIMSQYSANSQEEGARSIGLFCENLRRYRAGRPLVGLVDKVAGY